jgi:ParB-like chromosome segregation protein Spo0J
MDIEQLAQAIVECINSANDKADAVEKLRQIIHAVASNNTQPVDYVRWIPIDDVQPNDYNPNAVASVEMRLLQTSIDHDGYTQPVVTVYDPELKKYIIVDGFHRYYVMKACPEIRERCHGLLPVVVIHKDINDRMASTIRHNRARGKHSVNGMASLVFGMLDNGWGDAEICNELGMEAEELLRLKHITGFSKLFADVDYKKSWVTTAQVRLKTKQ